MRGVSTSSERYFKDISPEKEAQNDGPFHKKGNQGRPYPNGLYEQRDLFCRDLGNTSRDRHPSRRL